MISWLFYFTLVFPLSWHGLMYNTLVSYGIEFLCRYYVLREGLWRSMAYGEDLHVFITFLGQVLNGFFVKNKYNDLVALSSTMWTCVNLFILNQVPKITIITLTLLNSLVSCSMGPRIKWPSLFFTFGIPHLWGVIYLTTIEFPTNVYILSKFFVCDLLRWKRTVI